MEKRALQHTGSLKDNIMTAQWKIDLKLWKKQYPFYKRFVYFLIGYPPKASELSEDCWREWAARFDAPEYDWTLSTRSRKA